MKRVRLSLIRNKIIIVLSIINLSCITGLAYGTSQSPQAQALPVSLLMKKLEPTTLQGVPARIIIPELAIDLPVDQGNYHQDIDSWTLSADKAQYATPSIPVNNQAGNTLIYGHNNRQVFAGLKNLRIGMIAEVITSNGGHFFYKYASVSVVEPNDLSVFTYQGPPTLTLQTCSGNFFENRQMSHFELVQVDVAAASSLEHQVRHDRLLSAIRALSVNDTKQTQVNSPANL